MIQMQMLSFSLKYKTLKFLLLKTELKKKKIRNKNCDPLISSGSQKMKHGNYLKNQTNKQICLK